MIRDLSETLMAILDDPTLAIDFPELAAAQIVFDRPAGTFSPGQTAIDLFLYDIRENMELRSNEPRYERLNGQTRIHRPPMRVACSYLVTAWPVGGTDLEMQEHRLLSQVMQVLSRYPKIPAPFLRGKLVGQEPPLPMMTAQTDGLREPAEFWTAIGNKLRPSLTVTATIGMEVFPPEAPPPFTVTTAVIRLGKRTGPDEEVISLPTQLTSFWIGGRVTDAGNAPVADAFVTLVGTGLAARTGADGNYTLGSILAGAYTLRAQSGATTTDVNITIPASAGSNYNVQL
jgi:Pvc16 N-terminal domain/Carboxypeptidase regulatory-like domain